MKADFQRLYDRIEELTSSNVNLMEVCGTHTVAISRFGLRSQLPARLRLLSGPGCPVCVSPAGYIDSLVKLSLTPGVMLTTFGDLLRVPGSNESLQDVRPRGASFKMVYSPLEALQYAIANPAVDVVFAAVGFETTLPAIAATVLQAERASVSNLTFLSAGRLALPAMSALLQANEVKIDGFICPGHVSVITGSDAYNSLSRDFHVPCVITGFEAEDILTSIVMLLEQISDERATVENQYSRAVTPEGNLQAKKLMAQVFEIVDAEWRGIGVIPLSGVALHENYSRFDAAKRFNLSVSGKGEQPPGCSCGEIMRGVLLPVECELFGAACIPSHPVGPCMVSSEGACSAYYNYGVTGKGGRA